MTIYNLEARRRYLINTDPQRRCYNGCHFSSELIWGEWYVLEVKIDEETAERKMKFWKELNAEAVSDRGEEAKREFRLVEVNGEENVNA